MGHQPRAPSPLSQSFGPYQSTHIAPLNIVPRPCTLSKNYLSPITTSFPQSLLQDNVQNLWEMVDTALGHSSCSSSSLTTHTKTRTNSMDSRNRSQLSIFVTAEPESPSYSTGVDNDASTLIALSPRTFNLARTDLTKVHESIVSRLNNDTLLTLFPAPPQQMQPRCLIATPCPVAPVTSIAAAHIDATTTTTSITTTMTTETNEPPCLDEEVQAKIHKQKLAAKRNWVIPPGLVLVPSMESCNMSRAIDSSECSTTPESARNMPWASPYASQSCVSLPEISMSTPMDSDTASLSDSFVSTSSAASLPSTRSLDNLDSLSHRLWAFEMQMRRASFLVDDRASVLSTIVPSSTVPPADQEQSATSNIPPLRLATGKPSTTYYKDDSSSSSETNSPVEADLEKGWLAWQEEWTSSMGRGRLPAFSRASTPSDSLGEESDGDSSTVFSSIRSGHSSVVTAISHHSLSNLHQERFSKAGKPVNSNLFLTPKALNSKWHMVSESALSSPRTTPATPRSIKDNDPSLWETEHGQKWSDRFQFLVHNFQAAAGKHTRRLADIIPKSRSGRWGSKRMRSRHGEKEEEVRVK